MDRSENMSHIRGKDTSIEITLRKSLWKKGVRYRKNCKDVFGKSDICFKRKKSQFFAIVNFGMVNIISKASIYQKQIKSIG